MSKRLLKQILIGYIPAGLIWAAILAGITIWYAPRVTPLELALREPPVAVPPLDRAIAEVDDFRYQLDRAPEPPTRLIRQLDDVLAELRDVRDAVSVHVNVQRVTRRTSPQTPPVPAHP